METGELILRRHWLIANKVGRIQDSYDFEPKPLGTGAFGTVYKGKIKGHTGEGAWRAIKKIEKKKKVNHRSQFLDEVEILQKLDHPNIMKLYQTYEDEKNIYVVTEICNGGELFDMIIERGCFSEDEARGIFKQMLIALNYCHSQKVAHRDLKPQNFMFLNNQPDSPLKLIDFGMSFRLNSEKKAPNKTLVGTSYYMAPQVLRGVYNQKCDVWSAGVILYILLTGEPPFNGQTDDVILEMVKEMRYTFNIPEMNDISESAKDLIRSILVQSSKRPTAEQILKHPWINSDASHIPHKINLHRMKAYSNFSKLKKIAIMMIATQINQHDISELGKIFKSIDTKHDGVLTFDQIHKAYDKQKQKFGIMQIHKIIDQIDNQNNRTINYTQFIASCMEHHVFQKQDYVKMAFKMIDLNEDGKITHQELAQLFSQPQYEMQQSVIMQIIKECDKNQDGQIDYNQFLAMMSEV